MLPKKFRLPIKEFLAKKSKTIKTDYFYFKYLPNQLPFGRFGIHISKKIEKRASKRNKIRRMIYEYFQNQEKRSYFCGIDILIIPTKKVLNLTKEKIYQEIYQELKIR